jgi:hypothetical protein
LVAASTSLFEQEEAEEIEKWFFGGNEYLGALRLLPIEVFADKASARDRPGDMEAVTP